MSKYDNEPSPVTTKVNENGRIVIPAAIRQQMNLEPGDSIVMEVEDGVLHLESYRSRIRRIQEEFKKYAKPGVLASDELIAERRQEALLEQVNFEHARELRRIRDGYQPPESTTPERKPGTSQKPEDQVA
jgi:AbrB family looped-hinge helix DNA binding protein